MVIQFSSYELYIMQCKCVISWLIPIKILYYGYVKIDVTNIINDDNQYYQNTLELF